MVHAWSTATRAATSTGWSSRSFRNPAWVGFYAVCMVVVGFHLWHGFSSAFESLGLNHPKLTPKVLKAGKVLAILLGAGFFSIPIWIVLHRGPIMSGAPRIAPAGTRQLDAKIPSGPMPDKWDRHRFDAKLVNPANRRKFTVIVVAPGLAGGVGRGLARRSSATTS